MRVFLTGASGFIGSHLAPELIGAGHHVTGLCRSATKARALAALGAEVVEGDVNDLALVSSAAAAAEAVVHTAFDHDQHDERRHSEDDRAVIATLGEALVGDDRPLIITSGTALVRSPSAAPVTEVDDHESSDRFPRAATEEAADALINQGVSVMVIRLSQVHDECRQGRVSWQIDAARRMGRVVYVGDGENRVAAVHVSDTARLYRLVLEHGRAGQRYHAVAEEEIRLRQICEVIGAGLGLPVESISAEEARARLGPLGDRIGLDLPASGALTRHRLGWVPRGPGLLADLRAMDYQAISR